MTAHDESIYAHVDSLDLLNKPARLEQKLAAIHESLFAHADFIDRISVAKYDPTTDELKTFLASSPGSNDLVRYEAKLSESPSLLEILKAGRPRVVQDLGLFREGMHIHTKIIAKEGYHFSYTSPMYLNGVFWGFIFFNSRTGNARLDGAMLRVLDVYAHLISALVTAEMLSVRILAATIKTAQDMVHFRDPETGEHIERMARYARLIAQHLAATGVASFDDETIERIFEFAPLHDIGKIAIPDRILLKNGKLSVEEREEMKMHTLRGREMIRSIASNFGLDHLDGLELLERIAESHHEAMDGSGYPRGLRGDEIPLEARIVAVADVFDALTSTRPYKPSWTNEEVFAWLRGLAHKKFDEDCVEALIFNADKVREIQRQFPDTPPAQQDGGAPAPNP